MESFLNTFLENFVPIISSILATTIIILARNFIKKYGVKLDIETNQRLDDFVSGLAQQGATYAEQWAKVRSKTMPEGVKVSSSDKMHKAMEYVAEQIEKYKINKLGEVELVKKIESMLGFSTLNTNAVPGNVIEEEEDNENLFGN